MRARGPVGGYGRGSYDPASSAARSAAYRARHGIKRGASGSRRRTLWDRMNFVAIDGEGFSDGPAFSVSCPHSKIIYSGHQHYYALLKASDGSEIYAPFGRLTMQQCLEFLCDVKERDKNAVLVIFGGPYDVCQMLAFGLTRADVATVVRSADRNDGHSLGVEIGDWYYEISYRPRKSLTLKRWPADASRWQLVKGHWRKTKHLTVTLWDVWGFFQSSFTEVMAKWCPDDPDYQMIREKKGERSIFERSEIEDIRRYTDAELRVLVHVMTRLKAAIERVGLRITRWDGSGSIATAAFRAHKVREHMQDTPAHVFQAACHAYSGGHIEAMMLGHQWRPGELIHHYDITSAYPDIFRTLPSLAPDSGRWVQGRGGQLPAGFTVVRVQWSFPPGRPFYPLFFRTERGAILYPRQGQGWYWLPEYEAALAYQAALGGELRVVEWITWQQDMPTRPFAWAEEYFQMRQQAQARSRDAGADDGLEKVLKLILNSLSGKTCQQVGWSWNDDGSIKKPRYFQLEWAGYVTSGARARLMQAAITNPYAVISMATDGIFSTSPLGVASKDDKAACELGDWHHQTHDGMTIAMPGVYWLHDGQRTEHLSRGFDKRKLQDHELVLQAWREGREAMPIELVRLIGLGTAAGSATFWKLRGCFVTSPRTLDLTGDNSKRNGLSVRGSQPDHRMVPTWPKSYQGELRISAPYKVAWEGVERDPDEGEALREEDDMLDASLV